MLSEECFYMDKGIGFTLTKTERICGKKRIEHLFSEGNSFLAYPFRVVWMTRPSTPPTASMLVSIPKKRLKRAVDRNRMKRLTREAYRLHKQQLINLLQSADTRLDIAFIYIKDQPTDFNAVEKGIVKAIEELRKEELRKEELRKEELRKEEPGKIKQTTA